MSDPEIIFSTINRDSWHRRETGKGRKKKPKQNHNRNINSAENGESSCLPSSRTTNFPGNSRNKRKKIYGRVGDQTANRESRESIQIFWLGQYWVENECQASSFAATSPLNSQHNGVSFVHGEKIFKKRKLERSGKVSTKHTTKQSSIWNAQVTKNLLLPKRMYIYIWRERKRYIKVYQLFSCSHSSSINLSKY